MQVSTKNLIIGGISGALLGSIPGYLIDKGKGAAIGALLGGVGLAVVGYAQTTTPGPTGVAGPKEAGIGQISPQTRRRTR